LMGAPRGPPMAPPTRSSSSEMEKAWSTYAMPPRDRAGSETLGQTGEGRGGEGREGSGALLCWVGKK
jgi:hypothetical protein